MLQTKKVNMEVRRMRPKAKMNPLDKRIKPNPKYSKVLTPLSLKVSIVLSGRANNKHWEQSEERA